MIPRFMPELWPKSSAFTIKNLALDMGLDLLLWIQPITDKTLPKTPRSVYRVPEDDQRGKRPLVW